MKHLKSGWILVTLNTTQAKVNTHTLTLLALVCSNFDVSFLLANFKWDKIIQHSCLDPRRFWDEEGGWEALLGESDDEEEDESGDDSGFEMDTNEDLSSESDNDYSEGSESDFSGSGGESESEEEEESEGEDWEEMDRKAKEEDFKKFSGDLMKRKREESDEEDRGFKPKTKKRRK